MDVATMRRADKWLGTPACALLTFVRRLTDRRRRRTVRPLRKILFVKLAEQGSTVLAYAAFQRAVAEVGRENVYFLVFEENRFIMDVMGVIPPENVISIAGKNIFGVVISALAAVRRMWRERIDAAIDMEFFARSSAAMSYLSGASRRAGFHSFNGEAAYRGDLMTHRLSFNPYLHASQTFQILIDALLRVAPESLPTYPHLPPPPGDAPPAFVPGSGEQERVRGKVLEQLGRTDLPPLILINANCSDLLPLRKWPTPNYVELSRMILEQFPDVCLAFTGAPSEAPPAELLVREIGDPRCVCMAGRTTLRELLVLYTLAEVMVTNDSGPAHFATLTPMHVITMFGPETPRLFAAQNERNHPIWLGLTCSPCVNAYNDRWSACKDNQCMKQITVEEVAEKVCEVLKERKKVKSKKRKK